MSVRIGFGLVVYRHAILEVEEVTINLDREMDYESVEINISKE